jgi:hypothetical protein
MLEIRRANVPNRSPFPRQNGHWRCIPVYRAILCARVVGREKRVGGSWRPLLRCVCLSMGEVKQDQFEANSLAGRDSCASVNLIRSGVSAERRQYLHPRWQRSPEPPLRRGCRSSADSLVRLFALGCVGLADSAVRAPWVAAMARPLDCGDWSPLWMPRGLVRPAEPRPAVRESQCDDSFASGLRDSRAREPVG